MRLEEKCYAKINLVLNIVGRGEKRHFLDTVMTPFAIFDTLYATARADKEVTVTYSDNRTFLNDTVVIAAKAFIERYGVNGVDFFIDKRIPMGAGLGGSSADAGGAVRALRRLYGTEDADNGFLLTIGSDVPYMYRGGDMRVKGEGELLTEVTLPRLYKAVVVPNGTVSTAEAYGLYDRIGGVNADVDEYLRQVNLKTAERGFNALQRAGERLCEGVALAAKIMEESGFCPCMTGSGSGVYGYEYDKATYDKKIKALLEKSTDEIRIYRE